MTADELKAELPNVVEILKVLGSVLPPSASLAELAGFLDRAAAGRVELNFLHVALAQGAPSAGKSLRFA